MQRCWRWRQRRRHLQVETLHGHDLAAIRGHIFLKCTGNVVSIGVLRNERREIRAAMSRGVANDALHLVFRLEAQKIDAITAHAAIGRKTDDRHAAVACDGRNGRDRLREQRANDDFRTLIQKLAGRIGGSLGRGSFIARYQHNVRIVGIKQRKLRSFHHGLRQCAGLRGGIGEGQQDTDANRRAARGHVGQPEETGLVRGQQMARHGDRTGILLDNRLGRFDRFARTGCAARNKSRYRKCPCNGTKARGAEN